MLMIKAADEKMLRKIIIMVSIILFLFCMPSYADPYDGVTPDEELKQIFRPAFGNATEKLNKALTSLGIAIDVHFSDISNMLICTVILLVSGIILLCILAPCVFIVTSCIDTCTHCCGGNKETRAMKRNEKFKYFTERITALESMNGIKTEIEIVDKDAPPPPEKEKQQNQQQKPAEAKAAKKRKGKGGKKGDGKVEKSVGVSVDGQENKSVQKSL